MKPAAARERLGEGAHPQVDPVLDAERLAGAGAARAEDADAVRLVDHQPRAVLRAQVGDLAERRHVALHREDPVHHHEDAAAVPGRALEHRLELVHPVVAERPDPGARHHHRVEDRGVVGRVADHGVAGVEQRRDAADVRQVAGREDERVVGAHPVGDLLLELDVQRDRPVEEARAGQRRPVLLERVAGSLLDALVAGQAEVVVRAELDPLGALHRDDRPRLAFEQPEIRHQVLLAGRAKLLHAVVRAGFLEEVDGRWHSNRVRRRGGDRGQAGPVPRGPEAVHQAALADLS